MEAANTHSRLYIGYDDRAYITNDCIIINYRPTINDNRQTGITLVWISVKSILLISRKVIPNGESEVITVIRIISDGI